MAARKETIMMLKVDLNCPCCYNKVKKLLCSIPQIRDQTYNEKQNIVMIKVVYCSPEKIKDKLRCKGGKSIKDIQICEPPIPKPVQPNPTPKRPVQPNPPPRPPVQPNPSPRPPVQPNPPPRPPVQPNPPPTPLPDVIETPNLRPSCCSDCYEGRRTGPCYRGYGYGYGNVYGVPPPPPPPPGWWGYYYYYGGCPPGGYRLGYCVSQCCDYVSDDNPTACVVM